MRDCGPVSSPAQQSFSLWELWIGFDTAQPPVDGESMACWLQPCWQRFSMARSTIKLHRQISWEYFYYGKELEHVLGPTIPPESVALHWEAAKVGLKATWSADLIFGVVLLLANNPFRGWARLKNRQLVKMLPIVLMTAMGLGVLGGILGYEGMLTHLGTDFEDMNRADIFRPRRFMCTWGVHLGGYVGGLLGTLIAAGMVMEKRRRRKMKKS
jgi:hypothetical protein